MFIIFVGRHVRAPFGGEGFGVAGRAIWIIKNIKNKWERGGGR
jgi:hypothetical protein